MPWVDYEQIIPCGAQDPTPQPFGNDSGWHLSSASGPDESGELADLTGLLMTHGAPVSELSTDDEGVLVANQPGYSTAAHGVLAFEDEELPIGFGVKGVMSYGAEVPVDAPIVGVDGIWVGRVRPGYSDEVHINGFRMDETGNTVQTIVQEELFNDGVLTRYQRDLGVGQSLAVRRTAVREGWYQLSFGSGALTDVYEVAFLGVKVNWSVFEEDVIPLVRPQRVFPREDGLLGPGARRNYPPPRSRQRSPRIQGGYI